MSPPNQNIFDYIYSESLDKRHFNFPNFYSESLDKRHYFFNDYSNNDVPTFSSKEWVGIVLTAATIGKFLYSIGFHL